MKNPQLTGRAYRPYLEGYGLFNDAYKQVVWQTDQIIII